METMDTVAKIAQIAFGNDFGLHAEFCSNCFGNPDIDIAFIAEGSGCYCISLRQKFHCVDSNALTADQILSIAEFIRDNPRGDDA